MKSKVILSDCDGILLWWKYGIEKFVTEILKMKVTGNFDMYYRLEEWLNIHPSEASEMINRFHLSDGFADLPAFDDALEYVNRLHQEGWTFIAITACGFDERIIEMRRQNLETHFPGVFQEIRTVGVFDSKEEILNEYDPAIWVEDTWRHALAGYDVGHKSFLIKRDYNTDTSHEGPIVVSGWEEIYETITAPKGI